MSQTPSNADPAAQTKVSTDRDDSPAGATVAHEGAPAPEEVERPAPTPTGPEGVPQPTANIGVVGLAVMGSNLARNLASREGNSVAVFNRSRSKTDELLAEHPEAEFVPAFSYEEFAERLSKPRTAVISHRRLCPKGGRNCNVSSLRAICHEAWFCHRQPHAAPRHLDG